MSLTSVLKDPGIKAKFKERFPVPKMIHTDIRAKPLTKKYSLVGTAFDYLVRFHIKKFFPDAVGRKWVAEEAVEDIKLRSGEYVIVDGVTKPFDRTVPAHRQYPDSTDYHYMEYSKEWSDFVPVAEKVLSEAKVHYDDFIRTGIMTRNLFVSSLNLATLDLVIRTGRIFGMPTVTDDDIADLENLYELLKSSDVMVFAETAFLNPTFGDGSVLVGGADADLITDRILIDIKTTKSDLFTQDMYNQLLGYYALSTFEKKFEGIIEMGVYFSRYRRLDVVDAPDADAVKEITGWFEEYRESQ